MICPMPKAEANNWKQDTDKLWYFAIAKFNNWFIIHKIKEFKC